MRIVLVKTTKPCLTDKSISERSHRPVSWYTQLVLYLKEKKPYHVTPSPSMFSSTFLSSDLRTVQISLSCPQGQNTVFSGWLTHFDNVKSTGQGKKTNKQTLTPLPHSPIPSPAFPGRTFLPLFCCLLLLNLGIFQTHSPIWSLGSVRNKRESLFKTKPSHSAARNTSKHPQVSCSWLKVLCRSVLKRVGSHMWT